MSESAAGTIDYGLRCTAPRVAEMDPVTTVVWTWPAVTATLTASPTTITAGQSTTLTWTSANATNFAATGGGWSGNKPMSGNQSLTESYALAVPSVTLTFVITCTCSVSGLSGQSSASVVYNQPPVRKSGGGGAIDLMSVMALLALWGLQFREAVPKTSRSRLSN